MALKLLERDDYRYSFLDGMFANVYGTLTNGVFLTGFALYVGMNEFMIGLLVAIPYIVTLFQLPGSYYICRKGGRKKIACRAAAAARLMWLPLLIVGLVSFGEGPARCMLVLGLFLVSHSFAAFSYIAWISWTSDLVPDEIRGTFFGTRNMLCGLAGIVTILIFGNLVDLFKAQGGNASLAIAVPSGCAVLFGLISAYYLNRVSDVDTPSYCSRGLLQELSEPFRESNFRRFLLFAVCWNFSVYLAAPFFSLYFLRELKYSYGFVALLTTVGAVVDIFAMKFWGAVSDKIKNKVVIQFTGWGVVMLPSLWVVVRPEDVVVPVLIQLVSGGFWAGVNLCANNLLLRISPREGRVWFISAYSITAGLGAALAPIMGGLVLGLLNRYAPEVGDGGILPLHYLFIASTVFRTLSLLLFRSVHEPQEKSVRQTVLLLRGLRRPFTAAVRQKISPAILWWGRAARRAYRMIPLTRRPVARHKA